MQIKIIFDNEDDMAIKCNEMIRFGDRYIPTKVNDPHGDLKACLFKQLVQLIENTHEIDFFSLYGCYAKKFEVEQDGTVNIDIDFQYCCKSKED